MKKHNILLYNLKYIFKFYLNEYKSYYKLINLLIIFFYNKNILINFR